MARFAAFGGLCLLLAACGGGEPETKPAPSSAAAPQEKTADLTAARSGAADLDIHPPAGVGGALLMEVNALRETRTLPPLTWSGDLAKEAEALSETIAQANCSYSAARQAVADKADTTTLHWERSIRKLDGASLTQDLSPAFVVSEWATGADDYDPIAGKCWGGGACRDFAPLVRSTATQGGCAYKLCGGQEQVWICRVGP